MNFRSASTSDKHLEAWTREMIDDLHDMLNDPADPVPVPMTPEVYRAKWDAIKVYPAKKVGAE